MAGKNYADSGIVNADQLLAKLNATRPEGNKIICRHNWLDESWLSMEFLRCSRCGRLHMRSRAVPRRQKSSGPGAHPARET